MNISGISPQARRLSQFISLLALVGILVLPGCGGVIHPTTLLVNPGR